MDSLSRAFVIMPFDTEFTPIFEDIIKKPLVEAGYEVTRADSLLDQSNILSEIIRGITTAHLVVADLTTNSPNVFYELGLCHGLGVPTVLIAQSMTDVPFDLRSYKILIYETHFDKIKKLKTLLKDIGMKHRQNKITFGNPVVDFSARTTAPSESIAKVSLSEPPDELSDEPDEEGLLDFLANGERASQDLTNILAKLSRDNQNMTNRITRHTASMQQLTNNPTAGSAGRFHKISLLAASDMNTFSNKVEDILPLFEDTIDRLSKNYSGYIRLVDPTVDDQEGITRFRQLTEALLHSSREASAGMHSYRDAVIGIGERKISKELNRASRKQAEALNGILSNLQRVEAFSLKTLAMIDDRFDKKSELAGSFT